MTENGCIVTAAATAQIDLSYSPVGAARIASSNAWSPSTSCYTDSCGGVVVDVAADPAPRLGQSAAAADCADDDDSTVARRAPYTDLAGAQCQLAGRS